MPRLVTARIAAGVLERRAVERGGDAAALAAPCLAPSLTATAAISSPTPGSSHHAPSEALPSRPTQQRAGEVGAEHVLAALALGGGRAELVGEALLGDPEQRHEDRPTDREGDADPATSGRARRRPARGSTRRRRRGRAGRTGSATSFCARCSAAWENMRAPVKRQMMMTLAKPSIAESRPKPTSAIEAATMPAAMRDGALDGHPRERQPRQQPHAAAPARRSARGRSSRRARRRSAAGSALMLARARRRRRRAARGRGRSART